MTLDGTFWQLVLTLAGLTGTLTTGLVIGLACWLASRSGRKGG